MISMKHKEQRVLVLFDVQNMYYSAKHIYNTKVNFKEILDEAVAGRKLVRAIAYVIRTEIKDEVNFHEALNKIGIEVKAKDLQVFIGGAKKGDWDIGIAMDAVRLQPKIDTLVLVSGDGDFKDMLAYMKSHGCRTEVIAIGKTASKHIKEEADNFFDLESNPRRFLINYKGKFKLAPTLPPQLNRPPVPNGTDEKKGKDGAANMPSDDDKEKLKKLESKQEQILLAQEIPKDGRSGRAQELPMRRENIPPHKFPKKRQPEPDKRQRGRNNPLKKFPRRKPVFSKPQRNEDADEIQQDLMRANMEQIND